MPEAHALLSASAAARWLNCPPSARLCAEIPDEPTPYAAEGTLAHEMCEVKLEPFVTAVPKRTTASKLAALKKHELYQPEMDGYTDEYVDYIKKTALGLPGKAHIAVEQKVNYSGYAPEGFGTADCVIVCKDRMHIIDFKYGKGVPVSAEDNPQLKLYALGALEAYGMFYPINAVSLHIVQPRLKNFSVWETDVRYIRGWGESIKTVARQAFNGEGDFSSGDHCRFCKLKATCRKRAEDNLKLAEYEFAKPLSHAKDGEPTLSDDEVGEALSLAVNLKRWAEDLEGYALSAALSGKKIKGWKAVEGRTTRTFTDLEKVFQTLEANGFPRETFYERKPLPFTKIEAIVGKADFQKLLEHLIARSQGKPALVPESDKRPEFVPATTAQEDFKQ